MRLLGVETRPRSSVQLRCALRHGFPQFTLEEARANLQEAVQLVIESNRGRSVEAESGDLLTEILRISG